MLFPPAIFRQIPTTFTQANPFLQREFYQAKKIIVSSLNLTNTVSTFVSI